NLDQWPSLWNLCIFGQGIMDTLSAKESIKTGGRLKNIAKHNTFTRKCECPFQHGENNHKASHCPPEHPSHQQLAPSQVRTFNRTIKNTTNKIWKEELLGKTLIEVLLVFLKQSNWIFFAHTGFINLAHINHHEALLKATYQTNRYRLPLLYKDISRLSKASARKSGKHFPPGDSTAWGKFSNLWNRITHPKTVESFKERLSELKPFLSKQLAGLEYLRNSIIPVKGNFEVAWARYFPHLSSSNTPHFESGHALIKILISSLCLSIFLVLY
ncbi:uncharacterized protein VP01_2g9, partial [Puccinia sorghi]